MLPKLIFLFILALIVSCAQEQEPTKVEPITPKPEYTAEDPAEWESVKSDHLPFVEAIPSEGTIYIKVPGKDFNPSHYIEKIGIMNKDKQDLDVKAFGREDVPEAKFTIKPFPEDWKNTKIYVKCNLHDLWTTTLEKEVQNTRNRN
jgi:desulfoferrodoxin (superoxide reductase-like protein)